VTISPLLVPAPLARGARGAVVAPHHLASAAGLSVLRAGGSAVDAAIATNAALAVVMPSACGLGGDAFWLIWTERDRRLVALNGSGRAPAAASAQTLRHRGLRSIPYRGPLAITVPGAVRSWGDAHARFGRLSRGDVLAPAVELAGDGFPVGEPLTSGIERMTGIVGAEVGPEAAADFSDHFRSRGRAWRVGERIRLPALAATLARLSSAGFDDFYDGDLAERQARGLAKAGSWVTAADLHAHTSTWTEPIATNYRSVRVATHPPNSQGVTALEILNVLERFDPGGDARDSRPRNVHDARWIHLGIEASKLAMADRDAYLTDPDVVDVPVAELLSAAHADELAARIDPGRAAPAPAAATPRGGGTIYLAVVDDEGNAVSLIESNYMGFGSGIVDTSTGIHYQNRGSYCSLDPNHPNVLAPGKRTLHTLMPWMLFRQATRPDLDGAADRPWIVAGSMGGDAQPQIAAQLASSLVDGGVDVATAVAAPRWFVEPAEHFAPPVHVRAEPRFAPEILERLEEVGHPVTLAEPFDGRLGHAHAIELVDGGPVADGTLAAATDPRSEGLPATW
jgi:gamma-glutamyltranspeptidase/glutathione hydrolase